jgi:peroxiredoxin
MQSLARNVAMLLSCTLSLLGREYGPPVGAAVPDFELRDQFGKTHTLKSLIGPKGAVVLFFRSADWCAYCKSQIVELDRDQDNLRRLGIGVAAVSYDSVAVLRTFAERRGISIPLLSDVDSKVIRSMGILNESIPKDDPSYGLPYPGSFVLDATGVLASKFFEANHLKTYSFASILASGLGITPIPATTEVQSLGLKVVSKASDVLVAVGKRVSLTADVELEPGMYILARGAEGHVLVEFNIARSTALASSEVQLPTPTEYYLRAVNKSVAAYRGNLRIRTTVTIAEDQAVRQAVDADGNFWVEGLLRYQACSDSTCSPPQQMPLKWRFQYSGFDRERVQPALQRKAVAK